MKLAAKLGALMVMVVFVILAVEAYIEIDREQALIEADMRRDATVLGKALAAAVEAVWRDSGETIARRLIEQANRGKQWVRIRWVWMTNKSHVRDAPVVRMAKLGSVLHGRIQAIRHHPDGGAGHLYTYVPLQLGGDRRAALELSESLSVIDELARKAVVRRLVLLMVLVMACSLALLVLGFRMVGGPLAALANKTRRVSNGDLTGPLDLRRRDELGELADAMNQMCEDLSAAQRRVERETSARIEALEELRHADRLRSVGTLAAGLAHELGTPLNVVSARADLIASGRLTPTEVVHSATVIKQQAARITSIVRQILGFARKASGNKVLGDLRSLAEDTVDLLQAEARKQATALTLSGESEAALCEFDREQMRQVVTNLIANATQASRPAGRIQVGVVNRSAVAPKSKGEPHRAYACLYVEDEGEGIAEADLPHVFEPFFTTKDVGSGTGLGLSVAHGIVSEHGGWMEVESEVGKGSRFSVYLPRIVESRSV